MQRRTLLKALAARWPRCRSRPARPPRRPRRWRDVLDTPAQRSALAARARCSRGLARAGERLVAVGQRGHIAGLATTAARRWQQATVPVSSDLTAVYFVDAEAGWAVGHDGVVLHSADGGAQLGAPARRPHANELLLARCSASDAAEPRDDASWLAEAQRYAAQGADKPFLDVWFADAQQRLSSSAPTT